MKAKLCYCKTCNLHFHQIRIEGHLNTHGKVGPGYKDRTRMPKVTDSEGVTRQYDFRKDS